MQTIIRFWQWTKEGRNWMRRRWLKTSVSDSIWPKKHKSFAHVENAQALTLNANAIQVIFPFVIHSSWLMNLIHQNPIYPIFVVLRSTLWIGLHVSNFPSLFVLAEMEKPNIEEKKSTFSLIAYRFWRSYHYNCSENYWEIRFLFKTFADSTTENQVYFRWKINEPKMVMIR